MAQRPIIVAQRPSFGDGTAHLPGQRRKVRTALMPPEDGTDTLVSNGMAAIDMG